MRTTRVYRLHITYPPGIDWQNPPDAWESEDFYCPDGSLDSTEFQWPRERLFLSRSSALARAELLTKYGCLVDILASDPVTWPIINKEES